MCAEALYATARGLGCYRYPLLLTCPDLRTHAAFSPLVVPGGHANVQALATLSEARRRGHCRGLLREAERMMRGAGVPRLVIMYSDNSAAEDFELQGTMRCVRGVSRGFGDCATSRTRTTHFNFECEFSYLSLPPNPPPPSIYSLRAVAWHRNGAAQWVRHPPHHHQPSHCSAGWMELLVTRTATHPTTTFPSV